MGADLPPGSPWQLLPLALFLAALIVAAGVLVIVFFRLQGPLRRAALLGAVLVILDGLLLSQGIISIFVALIAVPVQLGFAVWAGIRKDRTRALSHVGALGLYLVSVVLVRGYIGVNNRIARDRAVALAGACEAYKASRGQFPDKLDDLVPAFVPILPRPNYTFSAHRFLYWYSPQRQQHFIVFVSLPPARRSLYSLESHQWSSGGD